jgi:hypothetical protein
MAFANDYTLGKGKFYFRRFEPGTQTPESDGFRRLGNVPEAAVQRTVEKLEHTSSEGGVNVKDASVDTSNDQGLTFSTDNVSLDNLALWFMSSVSEIVEVGGAVVAEALGAFNEGDYAQLGVTTTTPQGVRNVTLVSLDGKIGVAASAPLVEGTDYRVDLKRGLVEFLIDDLSDVTADYTAPAATRSVILDGTTTIEGELKFFADNPKGSNKDTHWPYVQLSPDGDYALIGTDWQTVGFSVTVLQPADGRPRSITEIA